MPEGTEGWHKRSRLRLNDGTCVLLRAEQARHVWNCDFVEDITHNGSKYGL